MVRLTRLGALALAGLLLGAAARAEEQLTLPVPDGWQTVTSLATPKLRMSSFAVPGPDGVEKLSFEWFAAGLTDDLDPFDLVEQVAGSIRRNCRGGTEQPVFSGLENDYPTVVRLLLCPEVNGEEPPRGELLMMKAIQGATGFWIVVRGRDLAAEDTPDPATLRGIVARWSEAMRAIRLCDPDTAAHPCPDVPSGTRRDTRTPPRPDS